MVNAFVIKFLLDYIAKKVKFNEKLPNKNSGRCKNDCNGNGKCDNSNYQCSCNKEFWGDDCSKEICPKKCSVKKLKS